MHIFLTGERGVGKSTVIDRTLGLLDWKAGGFFTFFGGDRLRPDRSLYLRNAWEPPAYDEKHTVALVRGNTPIPQPEQFEGLGVAALTDCLPWARLLVMDECGRLETGAPRFQKTVLARLDGSCPILGALKQDWQGCWLAQIPEHPAVRILGVTEENRDGLPKWLAGQFRERQQEKS